MNSKSFEVLYTHQKQKKNKTWQDGCLKVSCNGTKAVLYDDQKNSLEVFHIPLSKVLTGSDLECECYLINIGVEKTIDESSDHSLKVSSVANNHDNRYLNEHSHDHLSSWRKRKRHLSELKPDLPDPKHYTTENQSFQRHGTSIFQNTSNKTVNGGCRNKTFIPSSGIFKRHINLATCTSTPVPEDLTRKVTDCHAPSQKRNRQELLSFFSSKPQPRHVSQDQKIAWNMAKQTQERCESSSRCKVAELRDGCRTSVFENQSNTATFSRFQVQGNRDIYKVRKKGLFSTGSPDCHRCCPSTVLHEDVNYLPGGNREPMVGRLDQTEADSNDNATPFGKRSVYNANRGIRSSYGKDWSDNLEMETDFLTCVPEVEIAGFETGRSKSKTIGFLERNSKDEFLGFHVDDPEIDVLDPGYENEQAFNVTARFNENKNCKENLADNAITRDLLRFRNSNSTDNVQNTVQKRSLSVSRNHSFRPPLVSSLEVGLNTSRDELPGAAEPRQSNRTAGSSRQVTFSGQLYFPSNQECSGSVVPTRGVTIPCRFSSAMEYKKILKSALREHLNIILFEVAQSFHGILSKVDIASSDTFSGEKENIKGPSCSHGQAKLRAVKKDGPNKGRHFYSCPGSGTSQCKFFKWADECHSEYTSVNKKLPLTSSDSIRVYFKSKFWQELEILVMMHPTKSLCEGVHLYYSCHLERRVQMTNTRNSYGQRFSRRRQRCSDLNCEKKSMFIILKYRENSSVYSKDDIWIVSKSLSFEPNKTFVAKSIFYGPLSSGDLEIEPVSGYSSSNWKSGDTVHAIWICNAGTELSCIKNLEDHVTLQHMPLLPYILNGSLASRCLNRPQRSTFTAPICASLNRNSLGLVWPVTEEEAQKMVVTYKLNEDQTAALYSCARMFLSEEEDSESSPVTLIHGVFGAGKSFLLAVVIILMVKLFEISDSPNEPRPNSIDWKILISSTTNVAVDRIFLGLLDLGFDQFVRVGSMRKIAKPILPFSIHSIGSESQELKELQAMLKSDLTTSEKTYVRKSIERHKLGENRKRLASVRVVGVTCAACVFPSLEKLKFPVLLLDECSQMTEPASLLPMARFVCRKLVLVGDPNQLNPTIQGSKPEHDAGLEQTLFNRFMKMDFRPILLRTQYRCHPKISSIANRLFYDGNLLDGVTAEDRKPLVDFLPTVCFYNVSNGREECSQDGSFFNQREAKFVVVLIKSLLESEVEPTQIGVITQYKSQLNTVTNCLMSDGTISHKELKGIQISTVDAFQGGEKDVIILSCVRTQHVGFIDCKRRTNVALTRAKRHLCIVGCGRMLSSNALWGKVISYCRETAEGVQTPEVFIRHWNERRPVLDDNISKTENLLKRKKSQHDKDNPGPQEDTIDISSEVETLKDCEESILECDEKQEISADRETLIEEPLTKSFDDRQFSEQDNPSKDHSGNLECYEVPEIYPNKRTSIEKQAIKSSDGETENIFSEFASYFDSLADEDLLEFGVK